MPYPVFSPPSIQHGKLYVGMGAGDYLTPLRNPAGQVCCIDLATWQVDWTFSTPATVLGAVVATHESLVFGCADGNVYMLDRTGQLIRKWYSYAPIIASPAVTKGRVYVVNQDGMLYGLDLRRLEPVWQHRLGNPGRYVSSPTAAGGSVIIGTEQNRLLRVGRSLPPVDSRYWPGQSGGAGAGGSIDASPLPSRGSIGWQYSVDANDAELGTIVAGPVAVSGHHILVPTDGDDKRGLACLNWNPAEADSPSLRWFLPSTNGVSVSPAIMDQMGFFVDGVWGDPQRRLSALDLESGQRLWQQPVASDCSGALTIDHRGVLIQADSRAMSSLGFDGQLKWSQTLGAVNYPVATTSALTVVAISEPPRLAALDRPSGQVLWSIDLKHAPTSSPVIGHSCVLLGTKQGAQMRRLVDGKLTWLSSPDCGGVAGPLAVDDDRFYFVNDASQLIVAQLQDGRVLATMPGISLELPPLIAPNGLLVSDANRLLFARHDHWLESLGPWCPDEIGPSTSPAVLHQGRVYLGIRGRGLVCFDGGDP